MAVSHVNSAVTYGNGTTRSVSLDAGVGDDRAIVGGGYDTNLTQTVVGMSYAAVGMTEEAASGVLKAFSLAGAAQGVNILSLSLSGYSKPMLVGGSFAGVDQADPVDTPTTNSGNGSIKSCADTNVPTDGMTWGILRHGYASATQSIYGAGNTLEKAGRDGGSGRGIATGHRASDGVISWSGGGSASYNAIALPLKAAGGGGGTTPVTKDMTLQWAIHNAVTKDATLQYQLLNAIQKDVSLQYAMLNAVNKDATLQHQILQAISKDASFLWDIEAALSSVTKDLTAQWQILQSVSKDSTIRYDILNAVSRDANLQWAILEAVFKDATFHWGIDSALTSVTKDATFRWDIVSSVYKSLSVQYDILNSVTSDASIKFAILNAVSKDLTLKHDVLQAIEADATIQWSIISSTEKDITLRYQIQSENQFPDLEGTITLQSNTPVFTVQSLTPKITVH